MDTTKIRIKEHFGIVTNETSTRQIRFIISPPKNRQSIQEQDIVLLDHPIWGDKCQVFAQVKEIASYEEVAGSTLNERLGKMLATATIIGYADQQKDDKPIQPLLSPPNPGSRIYMPYAGFLEDAFARDRQGKPYEQPLHLGKTEVTAVTQEGQSQQVNVFFNGKDLAGMHTLVSAAAGAGKTNLAKVIISEFTQKTNLPIVIIDPNGEYTSINAPNYRVTTVTPQAENEEAPKIKPGQITIINGQTLNYAEKSEFFTSQIALLAKARLEKAAPSFLLIVEEPENVNADALVEVVASKKWCKHGSCCF